MVALLLRHQVQAPIGRNGWPRVCSAEAGAGFGSSMAYRYAPICHLQER